jgi:hypothetical protein
MNGRRGGPMVLGDLVAEGIRLIVWCIECGHQAEPDPDEMAARYGAEMMVVAWYRRLLCRQCGSRNVDFVLTEVQSPSEEPS